jgi:hypothetical protein
LRFRRHPRSHQPPSLTPAQINIARAR